MRPVAVGRSSDTGGYSHPLDDDDDAKSSSHMHASHTPHAFLLRASLAPATIARYTKASSGFYDYLIRMCIVPSTYAHVDELFTGYLHHLYNSGAGKAEAVAAFFGLNVAQPDVTRWMPMSRKALKGYARLKPSSQYPPLTWPVTKVIAVEMARRGHMSEAIGTLLSFDCLLRMGELLGIMHEDIVTGADPRIGAGGDDRLYVRLRKTKTGGEQGVELADDEVRILAVMARNMVAPGSRVFPFSDNQYRRLLHKVCLHLSLPAGYVHHSCRHGGATYFHLCGVPVTDIQHRGRWRSQKTATHYIQGGRQALMARSIPAAVSTAAVNIVSIIDAIASVLPRTRSL